MKLIKIIVSPVNCDKDFNYLLWLTCLGSVPLFPLAEQPVCLPLVLECWVQMEGSGSALLWKSRHCPHFRLMPQCMGGTRPDRKMPRKHLTCYRPLRTLGSVSCKCCREKCSDLFGPYYMTLQGERCATCPTNSVWLDFFFWPLIWSILGTLSRKINNSCVL